MSAAVHPVGHFGAAAPLGLVRSVWSCQQFVPGLAHTSQLPRLAGGQGMTSGSQLGPLETITPPPPPPQQVDYALQRLHSLSDVSRNS